MHHTSFLPETLRTIVGDGSIRTSFIHRPLIPVVGRNRFGIKPAPPPLTGKKFQIKMKNPFSILKNLDITLILFFNGVVNAVYYAVTATISTLFAEAYPFLSETQVGLCFLSIGGGMFFGSLSSGKILDWEFRRIGKGLDVNESRSSSEKKTTRLPDTQKTGKYAANFPIEKVGCQVIFSQHTEDLTISRLVCA